MHPSFRRLLRICVAVITSSHGGFVVHATGTVVADVATPGRIISALVGPGTDNLSVTATNMCGASAATPVQTVTIP